MSCEACRTIPPVISEGYTPKGITSKIGGLKFDTYVTGPATARTGIIAIYDIFGMSSQTIQGADLLAIRLNAVVMIPDFFRGDGAKHEWLPVDNEEKKAALMQFMSTKADIGQAVEYFPDIVQGYKSAFPSVEYWGSYGLCWGGKVIVLCSGPETLLAATAQVHPGRMDKDDAENIAIPHATLASKDEPADVVQAYSEIIAQKALGGFVELYDAMWHGWMGARANLQQEDSMAEYARGYAQLGEFFEKYLVADRV